MTVFEKVKRRMEDKLDFEYHDWDDMIECDGVDEQEIRDALNKLELKVKSE